MFLWRAHTISDCVVNAVNNSRLHLKRSSAFKTQSLMVCPWKKKTFSFLRHTPLVHADFLHAKTVHAENLHALPYYCHGRKKNFNFRSSKIKITFLLRFLNRFKSYHQNRIEVHADFLHALILVGLGGVIR